MTGDCLTKMHWKVPIQITIISKYLNEGIPSKFKTYRVKELHSNTVSPIFAFSIYLFFEIKTTLYLNTSISLFFLSYQ